MNKSKQMSSKSAMFAKGGSGKMAGRQSAGPQTPGQSTSMSKGNGGKFAKGGGAKMAGKQSAMPAKAR